MTVMDRHDWAAPWNTRRNVNEWQLPSIEIQVARFEHARLVSKGQRYRALGGGWSPDGQAGQPNTVAVTNIRP